MIAKSNDQEDDKTGPKQDFSDQRHPSGLNGHFSCMEHRQENKEKGAHLKKVDGVFPFHAAAPPHLGG